MVKLARVHEERRVHEPGSTRLYAADSFLHGDTRLSPLILLTDQMQSPMKYLQARVTIFKKVLP